MDTIGRRIYAARKRADMKQNETAAAVGISGAHLSKIESDKDRPSLEVVIKLAVLFQCDVADLAGDDEDLNRAEISTDPDEIRLIRAFRRMAPDERAGVTALITGKRAA